MESVVVITGVTTLGKESVSLYNFKRVPLLTVVVLVLKISRN